MILEYDELRRQFWFDSTELQKFRGIPHGLTGQGYRYYIDDWYPYNAQTLKNISGTVRRMSKRALARAHEIESIESSIGKRRHIEKYREYFAMNPYPGWGDPDWDHVSGIPNIRPRFRKLVESLPPDKPYMISETGGSAVYGFHDPYRARWSEEYQARLLTEAASVALNDPRYCGLAVWQFCDAKSYINGYVLGRPRGFNDKGVCDEYRRPKLAWGALRQCILNSEYLKHNGGIPVLEEPELE